MILFHTMIIVPFIIAVILAATSCINGLKLISSRRFLHIPLFLVSSGDESPIGIRSETFWGKLNYVDISKRSEQIFSDGIQNGTRNVFLVPKSAFVEFKDRNVSSLAQKVLDITGQSLSKFPAAVGGFKLLSIPTVSLSGDDIFGSNFTALFYDDGALTVGNKNVHKVFDSIWSSALLSPSTPAANESSLQDGTSINFLFFNHSKVPEVTANALSLSWALNSYK